MKIKINIHQLILSGYYSYHDYKIISNVVENELIRVIRERGLPDSFTGYKDIPRIGTKINMNSFNRDNRNPKDIGKEIAKIIYNTCNSSTKL